jgi:PIN domain nuclease of toxin-antitoxin system
MMLLDTNALIWALSAPKKFGRQFLRRFEGAGWAYYSPISIFELQLLSRKHRGPEVSKDISKMLNSIGLVELSYNSEAALAATNFGELVSTDPFDWMLIAQASAAEVDFYTSDQRLLNLGLKFVKDSSV